MQLAFSPCPCLDERLGPLKNIPCNDCWVSPLHIIPGSLPLIPFLHKGERCCGEFLLAERVTDVFLVGKDIVDAACRPSDFAVTGADRKPVHISSNIQGAFPLEIAVKDQAALPWPSRPGFIARRRGLFAPSGSWRALGVMPVWCSALLVCRCRGARGGNFPLTSLTGQIRGQNETPPKNFL